jgi:tetratricopeptide (TPR) repeat protein
MIGNLFGDRYRVLQVLNTTDVGETYLTKDLEVNTEESFVVKEIPFLKANTKAIKHIKSAFKNPVNGQDKLDNESKQIQSFFDLLEDKEKFYLVRKFVKGKSLTEEILPGNRLKQDNVINILSEILEILSTLHNRQIIHQNIKPANIIRRESDEKLVLLDISTTQEALVNKILASQFNWSEYIPMEQHYGNPQYASDIYSLGIIAIESLTGLTAKEITAPASPKNLLTGEISWYNPKLKIHKKLRKIINKMVQLDYRSRYKNANDVLRDLRILTDRYYAQTVVRKRRKKLILASGITTFVLVGLATWLFLGPKDIEYAKVLYNQGLDSYQAGDYKAALNKFTQAINIDPDYAAAYNKRGDSFYRLGDYNKSQKDSSDAIRLNPKDGNAYYDRGFILYSEGNYNGAIADFQEALKLDPNNADAYYGMGLGRTEINQKKLALEDLNRAISLKSDFVDAYLQRATVYRQLGMKLEALKDFDEAIAIKPNDPKAYYERALAHDLLNEKRPAIDDFTKAIELDPNYIDAYVGRGDVYGDLEYPEKAITDYNQALQINPKFAQAYIRRGNYYLQAGNSVTAMEDLNQAITLDAKSASAYNFRGNAFLEQGKLNEAVADYSKAIEINSNYALAYYNRALLLTDLGKVPEAIEDFQKAAEFFQAKGDSKNYNEAMSHLAALSPKG